MALQLNFSNLTSMGTIESFIGFLFQASVTTKLHHWKQKGTGSYAAHVALGDISSFLVSVIDGLVETAQTEKLLNITVSSSIIDGEPLAYLESILQYVRKNRGVFPYSFQANIVDTIEENLSLAIYKLRHLK